jgi:hypothetical protein
MREESPHKKNVRNKIISYLEVAYIDDTELNDVLAENLLEANEYYLYCKEGADDLLENVYDVLEDDFMEYVEKHPDATINVRALVEEIYKLKVA